MFVILFFVSFVMGFILLKFFCFQKLSVLVYVYVKLWIRLKGQYDFKYSRCLIAKGLNKNEHLHKYMVVES